MAAAAADFNRVGYHGTDSNRLARAAGYAPGSFYKHFPDKRAIFLAAYEDWVTAEWTAVEAVVARRRRAGAMSPRAWSTPCPALHRRWRGLRASMRALVADAGGARLLPPPAPPSARPAGRATSGAAARRRRATRVLLYTLERVCDAVADGELRELGLETRR